jgi:hypothetical protein
MITRALLLAVLLTAGLSFGADLNGKWTASFETQIGTQEYTYTFQADGEKLSGTAKSANGESKISEGKISGDTVTFVEMLNFGGQEIRIVYKGKISGDEIKFTRNVADFATEELTAKRAK